MTARLPVPGSDNDIWGTILNEFLTVAHNPDGTILANALPGATAAAKGTLQLGGDLSGTAANPTVVATHLSSALPINQGGTGSATQNFVDLTSSQTKTGTFIAPFQDKGGQVFNVKAYGAVGDGTADDTAAVQNAIDAACAVTGRVFFPPGKYLLGPLTFNAYFEMVGSGISDETFSYGTRLVLKSGANAYLLTSNAATNTFLSIRIADLMIDGNAPSQTAGPSGGIDITGPVACSFERVSFYRCYDFGVRLKPIANGSFGHHNRFVRCSFTHGSGGSGGGVQANNCDENTYEVCDWEYNAGYSVDDEAGLQIILGGTFVSNTGTCVRSGAGKGKVAVIGAIFDSNTGDSIYINGGYGLVQGCRFDQSGSDAIAINEFYSSTLIIGNTFRNNGGTNSYINEKPSGTINHASNGNSIVGNFFVTSSPPTNGMIVRNNPLTLVAFNGPSTAYSTAVTADAPLAWWQLSDFAGATSATDSSGNSHTGTPASVTFGLIGPLSPNAPTTAAYFDGSTSKITTAYNPALTAISVELIVKVPVQLSTTREYVANSDTSNDNRGFAFKLVNGVPTLTVGTGAANGSCAAPNAIADGAWHHVMGTWDGATIKMYIDGELANSAAFSGTLAAGSTNLAIGYNPATSAGYAPGFVSQVAVYGAALSATRVQAHFLAMNTA
jgi:hypothetical protein